MKLFRILPLIFSLFPTLLTGGTADYSSWFKDINGENTGHTVANFLSLPSSAAELGLGSAPYCGMADASDVGLYTANTAVLNRKKFSANHLEWLMGLRKENLSACFPLEEIGTVGIYSQLFTPGTFTNARDIDQETSSPSMIDYSMGMSFAKGFFDQKFLAGATFSYVESRLDNSIGRTVSAGADASFLPTQWLFTHLYVANLSPGLTYSTKSAIEPLPLQIGFSFAASPLEFQDALSATFDPKISVGVKKTADEPLMVGGGLQSILFKFLTIRTGYDYSLGNTAGTTGLSAGVGFEGKKFGADFGWRNQSKDFGAVWSASLKMKLKELTQKSAEDHFKTAEQFFKVTNYKQSLRYAYKALDLDPNFWKAHTLISLIGTLTRRENGTEMAVIYTGNNYGQFLPVQLDDGPLGGLPRQASVIRTLRQQFPLTLVIDAGNVIVATSNLDKAKIADDFFFELNYDAMALGKGEFDFGVEQFLSKNKNSTTRYLCSNIQSTFGSDIITKKTVSVGPYTFFIVACVNPVLIAKKENQDRLTPVIEEISTDLSKSSAKSATLRILIANDTWENIAKLARTLPQIDIILCGNIKQKFESPMKIGNALVISPGDLGKFVGKLVLRFNSNKKLVSFDNHCIALTGDIPSDTIIGSRLRSIMTNLDIKELATTEPRLKKGPQSGVFAFMSDRDSVTGMYLKMIDNHVEFPLTGSKAVCSNPVVSFTGGKIAYFEKRTDSSCSALRIMDITGVNKRTIPFAGCISSMRFSPDGTWLYFTGQTDSTSPDIFRIKPEGSTVYPVVTWGNSSENGLDFSPDGKFMVFMSSGSGKNQLFFTDTTVQKTVCITEGSGDNKSPIFSPNGAYFAFLSNKTSFKGAYDLWLYDIVDGKALQMTSRANVKGFCWLSDSKTIVYSGGDTLSSLRTLNILTNDPAMLIARDSIKNYNETTPRVIEYKKGEKIIYTREYIGGDKKIFWVNPDGTGNQRVVSSKGREWLE